MSKAEVRHLSSPPSSLFNFAVLLRMGVRCVVLAAKTITRCHGSLIAVKHSRCPISDFKARVRSSRGSCLIICFPLVDDIFCLHHVHGPDTTNKKQRMSSAGRVVKHADDSAMPASRPPAEQEATSRVCGSNCPRCTADTS